MTWYSRTENSNRPCPLFPDYLPVRDGSVGTFALTGCTDLVASFGSPFL